MNLLPCPSFLCSSPSVSFRSQSQIMDHIHPWKVTNYIQLYAKQLCNTGFYPWHAWCDSTNFQTQCHNSTLNQWLTSWLNLLLVCERAKGGDLWKDVGMRCQNCVEVLKRTKKGQICQNLGRFIPSIPSGICVHGNGTELHSIWLIIFKQLPKFLQFHWFTAFQTHVYIR